MKKTFTIAFVTVTIILALITGCRKDNVPASEKTLPESSLADNFLKTDCRLVHHEWQGAYTWDFHYNEKGLVDKWKIDIGDGFPQTYTIYYDRFNRLIKDRDTVENGPTSMDNYRYSGNRVVEDKWTTGDGSASGDILFSYNSRGQIIKTDDNVNDLHTIMTYDRAGNLIRSNYYQGSDLYFSDNYTFYKPIENPYRTIQGLDFAFPYSGVGLWNRWWFTSNTGIIYDNGTPTVIYDYDPSKTTFKTGFLHHLNLAGYYDNITQTTSDISFEYDHCGGHWDFPGTSSSQNNRTSKANKTAASIRTLFFHGTAKSIKEQIKKFKTQMN